ncbi:MAG: hypothetical protein QOJ40_2737 [Verrucomicrobiota bacterium]
MDRKAAKQTLALYRPGSADESDSDFTEALEFVKRDPDLARWFEEHCALYAAVRSKFEQIPVPEGLKEQIVSEQKARSSIASRSRAAFIAICAVIVLLLLALGAFYLRPTDDRSLAAFGARMAGIVLRAYPKMDLETNNLAVIHDYVAQNGGQDYALPKGLKTASGTGCKILTWHGKRVSMVCFNSGKNAAANTPDLFLFIIQRSGLSNPPVSNSPQFARVSGLTGASWSRGNLTYVLQGMGDETFLLNFL